MAAQPNFKINSATRARIEQLAAMQDTTPDEIVRRAVDAYIVEEESEDELLTRAQVAWDDYQTTGLHLTGDEVDEWLAKIEAGENPPMPPCHT